jgi:hypothetical protein
MLARITPGPSGFDIRTFECPACDHVHQLVVELVDPMRSPKTEGCFMDNYGRPRDFSLQNAESDYPRTQINIVTDSKSTVATKRLGARPFKQKTALVRAALDRIVES